MKIARNQFFMAGFAAAIALLGAVLWTERQQLERTEETRAWVAQTNRATAALSQLLVLAERIHGVDGGFVLSGDPAVLMPYDGAVKELPKQLSLTGSLLRDPEQHTTLTTVKALIEQRAANADRVVNLRRTDGLEAARQAVASGTNTILMDEIRLRIGQMQARQQILLEEREAKFFLDVHRNKMIAWAGTGLSISLLVALFVLSLRENRRREQSNIAFAEREADLIRFKLTLDQTLDCVFLIGTRGLQFKYANRGAILQLGYSEQELRRMTPLDINPDFDEATFRAKMQPLTDNEVPSLTFETTHRQKDGHKIAVEAFVQIVRVDDRKPQFVYIVRDIATRKEAERALIESKLLAEQANAAKDMFLATMSHEIRTPLNGLLGMLELLSLSPLDREQSETLAVARDSGRGMGRIIDDILDHAKIEAGKLEIMPEPVAMARLLPRIVNTYQAVASSKGLVLRQMVDPRLSPALMADPLRLLQVLGNFVSNALKFTTEGYVEVRADLVRREGNLETVRLSVKDTGIGMTQEVQERLFQPFEQASTDITRLYGGTGLGLAISQRLVALMGGEIWLDSNPGTGTTMNVTMTLSITDDMAADRSGHMAVIPMPARIIRPEIPETRVEMAPDIGGDGPLVLAVDDNPVNRMLLSRQLGTLGLRVQTAADGREALERWRNNEFALVITDCNMPEMDGYALARAIRAGEEKLGRMHRPVLAWTANALPDTVEKCLAAGMDDVLTKPSELARLKALVTKWLPATSNASPAIDMRILNDAFGNDKAGMAEMISRIHGQVNTQIDALTTILDGADLKAIEQASHRLKGAVGMLGATDLAAVCDRIETAGRRGETSPLIGLRSAFADAAKRVKDELNALRT